MTLQHYRTTATFAFLLLSTTHTWRGDARTAPPLPRLGIAASTGCAVGRCGVAGRGGVSLGMALQQRQPRGERSRKRVSDTHAQSQRSPQTDTSGPAGKRQRGGLFSASHAHDLCGVVGRRARQREAPFDANPCACCRCRFASAEAHVLMRRPRDPIPASGRRRRGWSRSRRGAIADVRVQGS